MNVKLQMNMFREVKGICYNLSANETYCYVALRIILKNTDDYKIVTLNDLSIALTNTYKKLNTRTRNNLIDGLNGLQEKEIIIYQIISKGRYKINVKNMIIEDDLLFFSIPIEYINLITIQKNGINLLDYYVFILSTINIKTNLGYMSQEKIKEHKGLNRTTQTRHNNILVSLGVLIVHSRSGVDMNGNFVNATNVYCLPKDEDKSLDNDMNGLNKKIKDKNKELRSNKKKANFEVVSNDIIEEPTEPNESEYDNPFEGE